MVGQRRVREDSCLTPCVPSSWPLHPFNIWNVPINTIYSTSQSSPRSRLRVVPRIDRRSRRRNRAETPDRVLAPGRRKQDASALGRSKCSRTVRGKHQGDFKKDRLLGRRKSATARDGAQTFSRTDNAAETIFVGFFFDVFVVQ